jgi:hypothetical protein
VAVATATVAAGRVRPEVTVVGSVAPDRVVAVAKLAEREDGNGEDAEEAGADD